MGKSRQYKELRNGVPRRHDSLNSQKRNLWLSIKESAFKTNPVCGICKSKIEHIRLSCLDHIKPRSLGGRTVIGNFQLAHIRCNINKNNKYNEFYSNEPIKIDISLSLFEEGRFAYWFIK